MTWLINLLHSMREENKVSYTTIKTQYEDIVKKQDEIIKSFKEDVVEIRESIQDLTIEEASLAHRLTKVEEAITTANLFNTSLLKEEIKELTNKSNTSSQILNQDLKKLETCEKNLIKNNIIIKGLPVPENSSNPNAEVKALFNNILETNTEPLECFWLKKSQPSLIRVKLDSFETKLQIMKAKNKLKGKEAMQNVYMNSELSLKENLIEKHNRKFAYEMKKESKSVQIKHQKVIIGNTEYSWNIERNQILPLIARTQNRSKHDTSGNPASLTTNTNNLQKDHNKTTNYPY